MNSHPQNTCTSRIATHLMRFVVLQNQFQLKLGKALAWLALLLVMLSAAIVILRYGFQSGSIALQETILYIHAIFFMMGMAFTLQQDGHVRVDVFYSRLSPRHQAMIDLFGGLVFALPAMLFILWIGWDYVSDSWVIHESSAEAGGLPFLYLLKSFILIMAALMTLQILAMISLAFSQIVYPKHPKVIRLLAHQQHQKEAVL